MLDICLLGTGGMMPMPGRFLTSMLARLDGKLLLIDCGEGTQVTMKLLGWGFKAVETICFTHYHADHISGLPGILLTIGNAGRTEPLRLIGPPGLRHVVEGLCRIAPQLPFPLIFTEVTGKGTLTAGGFQISRLPLDHIMPCFAYRLDIHRKGRFDTNRAESLNLPKPYWSRLQKGESILHEGRTYTPDEVMGEPRPGISVAYCTDTRPVDALPGFVQGVDLFICEGMYGEDEKKEKAKGYKHMVFSEAATLAKRGHVCALWLTHFSPSLTQPADFLENARRIFPDTELGEDRKCTTLFFSKETGQTDN